MADKCYINKLQDMEMKKLPIELRKMMTDLVDVQKNVLLDILHNSEETEIGKRYNFKNIHSVEEYRKSVPITEYDDYRDDVERMKDGEENILFPGKAASFVVTSGTTGISKYIPESNQGAIIKSLVGKFRTVEMLSMVPQILQPEYNILVLTNASVYGKTQGGIPAGSASGQAAESGLMMEKMTLPLLLLTAKGLSNDANEYLTILFAVADKNIAALICNNLVQFHRLMNLLNTEAKSILNDLENKTISVNMPDDLKDEFVKILKERVTDERVEELKAIYNEKGEFNVKNLWHKFMAVSCWLSGSVGRSVKEFKSHFPQETLFIEWGYGASEGKFNIPVNPGKSDGFLAIFGLFFEFLPLGGKETVLLQNTEPEQMYELIITNYSGFYRYNIHDIVKVKRDANGFPLLTFLCKSKDYIEISGNKFYACNLMDIVEEYEEEKNVFFALIQGRNNDGKLELLVEMKDDNLDIEDFKKYMTNKLNEINIELSDIVLKDRGYRDSLFTKVLDSGKSVVSTKLPVFID